MARVQEPSELTDKLSDILRRADGPPFAQAVGGHAARWVKPTQLDHPEGFGGIGGRNRRAHRRAAIAPRLFVEGRGKDTAGAYWVQPSKSGRNRDDEGDNRQPAENENAAGSLSPDPIAPARLP
jgi:hypothetical protein